MNDLYFDTDSFDFFSLDDVKEVTPEESTDFYKGTRPTTSAESANPYGKQTTFEEPEEDESELFSKEEIKKFDPNNDTSDISNQSYEENKEANQEFHSLPDWAVIDLGDRQLTKADTIALADMRDHLMEEKAFFDVASRTDYEELINFIGNQAQAFKTETQLTVEALESALNNPMTPKEDRIELFDRLQKEKLKFDRINQELQKTETARKQQEDALLRYRIHNNHQGMRQLYGKNWDRDAKDIFEYAMSNGISEKMIQSYLDPALSTLFLKARAWDKQNAKTKQTIQNNWSRSTSTAQSSDKTSSVNSELRALRHRMSKTAIPSQEDNRAMFNFLKD